jgi:LacI family transcriptional regulator
MSRELDGLIISPARDVNEDHTPLLRLIHAGVPVVLVDRPLHGHDTDLVCTNSEMTAEALVSHLVELGHRRIAFAGTLKQPDLEERKAGYRRMMHARGLPVDEAWIHVDRNIGAGSDSKRAVRRLLSLTDADRPTAILCASAVIAAAIARAAGEMGLAVPRDLSLAGFEDVAVEPWRPQPAWLTTYAQPRRHIGQQSARLLMKRLRNLEQGSVSILLQGHVVQGTSTGPAPGTVKSASLDLQREKAGSDETESETNSLSEAR